MITASQARSMAETRWGRGGTTGYRTNRKGAFYYSCSGHGGYVIDSRCLTLQEQQDLKAHLWAKPDFALEIVHHYSNRVAKFRGPDSFRNVKYHSHSHFARQVLIFFGEEDSDWAIVEKFTDIRRKGDPT